MVATVVSGCRSGWRRKARQSMPRRRRRVAGRGERERRRGVYSKAKQAKAQEARGWTGGKGECGVQGI